MTIYCLFVKYNFCFPKKLLPQVLLPKPPKYVTGPNPKLQSYSHPYKQPVIPGRKVPGKVNQKLPSTCKIYQP